MEHVFASLKSFHRLENYGVDLAFVRLCNERYSHTRILSQANSRNVARVLTSLATNTCNNPTVSEVIQTVQATCLEEVER